MVSSVLSIVVVIANGGFVDVVCMRSQCVPCVIDAKSKAVTSTESVQRNHGIERSEIQTRRELSLREMHARTQHEHIKRDALAGHNQHRRCLECAPHDVQETHEVREGQEHAAEVDQAPRLVLVHGVRLHFLVVLIAPVAHRPVPVVITEPTDGQNECFQSITNTKCFVNKYLFARITL